MKPRLLAPNSVSFVLFAGLAAFSAYFCMYAFRKPFTAATFETVDGWAFALDYKIALVIAQVLGYALSKFLGIKLIAELDTARRAKAILGLIFIAWLALIGFALVPAPYNVALLFLNGVPLGLIWGLVFSYLEGRRTTEVLGAILCASFIISSGVVKSIGVWLMTAHNISEFWMPATTGALFMPLLAVSVFALSVLPAPTDGDIAQRVKRSPMSGTDRAAFLRRHGLGLALLVIAYVLFTMLRDFRDNFAADIWAAMGFADTASVFTLSELPVAVIALVSLALMMFVQDNRRAFTLVQGLIGLGAALIGLSTALYVLGWISPMAWMISNGAGLYLAYTPFNAVLFDRMIAVSGHTANAGFLIYVADASGYAGSVSLLLYKHFGAPEMDWLNFFIAAATGVSLLSVVLIALAARSFAKDFPHAEPQAAPA